MSNTSSGISLANYKNMSRQLIQVPPPHFFLIYQSVFKCLERFIDSQRGNRLTWNVTIFLVPQKLSEYVRLSAWLVRAHNNSNQFPQPFFTPTDIYPTNCQSIPTCLGNWLERTIALEGCN